MNILLQDWELPPFDQIKDTDYEPAVLAAIAEAERNVKAIADNRADPSFANTLEALEAADRRLQRVNAVLINLNECCTNDEMQQIVLRTEPEVTRLATRVMTDPDLYRRVQNVNQQWQTEIERHEPLSATPPSLDAEQQTLLENTLKAFRRNGVALPEPERTRFKRNAEELSELQLRFSQNALADLNSWTLHLTDEADLAGLPEAVRTAAHEEAAARGLQGWLFTLAAPSYVPFMTYSERRERREQMYRAYGSIGNRGNGHDNNAVIARIVALRAEQARLLGHDTYCDFVLRERMVRDLPTLQGFMQRLRDAVLPAAERDLADVRQAADGLDELMPWDFSFYAERLKRQRYDLDSEALRPWFPLEAVREGIFALYGRLYGLRFEEDRSVPVYHEDVRVYRVKDGSREMGLLYLDLFPRTSKRSGAWMTEFRGQHRERTAEDGEWRDVRPQIQVVCNFSKPTADTPSLLRFSEVETFMHEMGHAMHGMLSEVRYASLGGTNVKRDFVEMPSQVMENWCYEPAFLATFARHYLTGEPLPAENVEKIRAAQNHMAGWLCLRQINLGMTDIAFHTMKTGRGALADGTPPTHTADGHPQTPDPSFRAEAVEAEAMTNLLPRVPGCCTATNFSHIFGGGYASGYYGYKWAEVLDADIFSRFKEEGIFDRECAMRFRREILARGGAEHPYTLFRNFMGRDPDNKALLKRMNLL